MILQALYDYYQRKAADPSSQIAPEGWEWKEIPYVIIINEDGTFTGIEETREGEGRRRRSKKFLVPQSVNRTVGKKSNLLWDNIEYALGANPRNRDDIKERFNLFIERIKNETEPENIPSILSLLKFFENNPVEKIENSGYNELWQKMLDENPFIVFKIDGSSNNCICDDLRGKLKQLDQNKGDDICLITGETKTKVARLHSKIKGVRGGQTQGGALISFNLPSFNSYGKKQNYNSPISQSAAFAYTTALNILLGKDSKNKISIADTTIVYWAEKKTDDVNPEEMFSFLVSQKPDEDNPDKNVDRIKNLFKAIETGQFANESTNHFYVLGLSPNAARISVRFWKAPSVEDFGKNIKKHFDDFEMVHRDYQSKYLSLYEILSSISLETKKRDKPNVIYFRGKFYDVIPNLAGALIEAIIDGSQYPHTLLQQCIIRIRAEASKKDKNGKIIPNVSYPRAAILKACLNRKFHIQNSINMEIKMSLDKTNNNIGYLLGRLFSIIERAQFVSNGYKEPNAGIRDRFWGSFSSSPISVLPIIEKLYGHHLKKIKNIRKYYEANLLEENKKEIVDKLEPLNIPAHLTLDQQALFSIGYYHQKSELEKFRSSKEVIQSNNN